MSRQYDNYIHSLLEPDHRNEPLGGSPLLTQGNWRNRVWDEYVAKEGQEEIVKREQEYKQSQRAQFETNEN